MPNEKKRTASAWGRGGERARESGARAHALRGDGPKPNPACEVAPCAPHGGILPASLVGHERLTLRMQWMKSEVGTEICLKVE